MMAEVHTLNATTNDIASYGYEATNDVHTVFGWALVHCLDRGENFSRTLLKFTDDGTDFLHRKQSAIITCQL